MFVVLRDGIGAEGEDDEYNWPPWSNLQTIATVAAYHDSSLSLTDPLLAKKNAGHPLCNLPMSESVVGAVGSEAMGTERTRRDLRLHSRLAGAICAGVD